MRLGVESMMHFVPKYECEVDSLYKHELPEISPLHVEGVIASSDVINRYAELAGLMMHGGVSSGTGFSCGVFTS